MKGVRDAKADKAIAEQRQVSSHNDPRPHALLPLSNLLSGSLSGPMNDGLSVVSARMAKPYNQHVSSWPT